MSSVKAAPTLSFLLGFLGINSNYSTSSIGHALGSKCFSLKGSTSMGPSPYSTSWKMVIIPFPLSFFFFEVVWAKFKAVL